MDFLFIYVHNPVRLKIQMYNSEIGPLNGLHSSVLGLLLLYISDFQIVLIYFTEFPASTDDIAPCNRVSLSFLPRESKFCHGICSLLRLADLTLDLALRDLYTTVASSLHDSAVSQPLNE
jgi:hypothetical protein